MTGPVTFTDYNARSHLLTRGFVYTVRPTDRTTGQTWARWVRGGNGKLDVDIQRIGRATADRLKRYADRSGFEAPEAWKDRIDDLHGSDELAVYRVDLTGWRTEP